MTERKINVAEPKDYFAWITAATEGFINENAKRSPDGVSVDVAHMLCGLTAQTVRLLQILKMKRPPEDMEPLVRGVIEAVAEAVGASVRDMPLDDEDEGEQQAGETKH